MNTVEKRSDADPVCWSWPAPIGHHLGGAADLVDAALSEYEDTALSILADWQNERCGACGARSEVLDHDHTTGLVRGWLCRRCNVREGFFDCGARLVKYRQRHPAAILGVRVRYYSSFTGYAEPQPRDDELERAARAVYALAAALAD